MIDRERYALIKTFTDTLLEYKDEIRTLKERCNELEEQLNKKGSENMLDVLSEKNSEINKLTDCCIEKSSEIKKLTERCKALEEQLNKAQSSAIVYKDLFNEAKRFIGEDTLYRFIYENIDE